MFFMTTSPILSLSSTTCRAARKWLMKNQLFMLHIFFYGKLTCPVSGRVAPSWRRKFHTSLPAPSEQVKVTLNKSKSRSTSQIRQVTQQETNLLYFIKKK
jgi:hypothetical protein